MAFRVGGLLISRKPGETITLLKDGKPKSLICLNKIVNGLAYIAVDGTEYDMDINESVQIDDNAFYLESIEGGRAVIRLIFDDSVRIIRSELLGASSNVAQGRVHTHRPAGEKTEGN
jgi:hypothetical protein